MLPVGFPFADVGDMDFHDGDADGSDAVSEGNGGVGIAARVDHHAVVGTVSRLQCVNQNTFVVGLTVVKLDCWECFLERLEVSFKRDLSVNLGFAAT